MRFATDLWSACGPASMSAQASGGPACGSAATMVRPVPSRARQGRTSWQSSTRRSLAVSRSSLLPCLELEALASRLQDPKAH
jgi:hypothetical protein